MANTIQKVQTYLPQILDEVYKKASITSVLDLANAYVRPVAGAKGTVQIPSIAFGSGLGDYSRSEGFKGNAVTLEWEAFNLTKDRGTKFNIDYVENDEALGTVMANLASEFLRTQVVPEIDAIRFAAYSSAAATKLTGALTNDDIEDALEVAIATLADKEVSKDRLALFISNSAYSALKQSVKARRDVVGLTVVNGITMYDDIPVYPAPQNRLHTAVTLNSAGGFTPAGSEINFLLMDKNSAIQVVNHVSNKLITPEQNQSFDGYTWWYRIFHDAFVPKNKKDGIYVHTKA